MLRKGRLGYAGRVEMRSWLELKQMPFLVAAIIIRATKPDAIALDDLFLGLSGASYTSSRLWGCQAISQKAIAC